MRIHYGGIVGSLIAIAAGAILRYATVVPNKYVSLYTTGLIVLILGSIGLVVSVAFAVWEAYAASRDRQREREREWQRTQYTRDDDGEGPWEQRERELTRWR